MESLEAARLLAFGSGWLLIVSGSLKIRGHGRALLEETLSSIGFRWTALIAVTISAAEIVVGGIALTVAVFLPAGILLLGFALVHLALSRARPGLRCSCHGTVGRDSTFSTRGAVINGVLGVASIGAGLGQPIGSDATEAVIMRVAGASVCLLVLALEQFASDRVWRW